MIIMQKPQRRIALWLGLFIAACLALAYPAARLGLFDWPREYDPLAIPNLAQKPGIITGWQMKLVDLSVRNCLDAFALAGSPRKEEPARIERPGCMVRTAIDVNVFARARVRPVQMRCALAARLYAWERHVLQPAAMRILGEPITEIIHMGSYSCRRIRGGRSMSQHATANAFDIGGFKTKSGKIISLLRDWDKPTKEGQLLYAARDGLCDWFNVTLSPDYNAAHADHFHVDMGRWHSCR
jgi:hypothetical protein